jgi:rhamnose transport system permease protein
MLGCWAIAAVVLHRARAGRYAFAIGASPRAARFAGVPVRGIRVALYTFSGAAAALAAIVYTARNNTAKSEDALYLELDVITCVLVGGASISGGRGTLAGVVLGVLILGFLRTGLVLEGVSEIYRRIAIGAILIAAATWNEYVGRRGGRGVPPV